MHASIINPKCLRNFCFIHCFNFGAFGSLLLLSKLILKQQLFSIFCDNHVVSSCVKYIINPIKGPSGTNNNIIKIFTKNVDSFEYNAVNTNE